MGYDAGLIRDEYNCNSEKCECATFDQTVIGKPTFWNSTIKQNHSGDIAVTENTFNKMIKPSDDSLRAYPNPNTNLWVQNFVNGQYLIDYEFDDGLNQNVKTMLPKVLVLGRNKTEDLQEVIEN